MEKKLIKVIVYPKTNTTKKGNKKFTTYSTSMNLIDDEGNLVKKTITCKFGKEVDTSKLPKGALLFTIKEEDISAPSRYHIKTTTDEEGNEVKTYPVVWINGFEEVNSYRKPVEQKQFVVDDNLLEDDEEIEMDNDNSPF